MFVYLEENCKADEFEKIQDSLITAQEIAVVEGKQCHYCIISQDSKTLRKAVLEGVAVLGLNWNISIASKRELLTEPDYLTSIAYSSISGKAEIEIRNVDGLVESIILNKDLIECFKYLESFYDTYCFSHLASLASKLESACINASIAAAFSRELGIARSLISLLYDPVCSRSDYFWPGRSGLTNLDDVEKLKLEAVFSKTRLGVSSYLLNDRISEQARFKYSQLNDYLENSSRYDATLNKVLSGTHSSVPVYIKWVSTLCSILGKLSVSKGVYNESFLYSVRALDIFTDGILLYLGRSQFNYSFGKYNYLVQGRHSGGLMERFNISVQAISAQEPSLISKKLENDLKGIIKLRNKLILTHGAIVANESVALSIHNEVRDYCILVDNGLGQKIRWEDLYSLGLPLENYDWMASLNGCVASSLSIDYI